MGYQDNYACNKSQTLAVVESGLNVVMWFALNLAKDATTGRPVIKEGPDPQCVADVRAAIEAKNLPTAHLISIGGWDAPHPDTSFTGEEWFKVWHEWNMALPRPFQGFDWDLEGNDKQSSPYNEIPPEVLHIVVDMSAAAKKAGYIVTMVPPQSYFDSSTSDFNLSLLNAYPDFHPNFHYRGLNCYAYMYAAAPPNTFDLVTVQLYESWSRADQALLQQGRPPAEVLEQLAKSYINGWEVDFGKNPQLRVSGRHFIKVPADKLVIGFSFGSSDGSGKMAFFWPESAGAARAAGGASFRPRGYAYWDIQEEGTAANGTETVLYMAAGLNKFLHVREQGAASQIIV